MSQSFRALGVSAEVAHALEQRGITTPFPIQSATIPDAMAGRDVLGRGQTGSGKTFAFGLPSITRLAAGERWSMAVGAPTYAAGNLHAGGTNILSFGTA